MQELKQQLIGQKEGLQFALDELEMIKESLKRRIDYLEKEIEKISDKC